MLIALSDEIPWNIVFGVAFAAVVMLVSAAIRRKK